MLRNIPVLRAFHALGMYYLWDQSSGFPLPSALCDLEYDFNAGNFFEVLDNCPNIHRLFISTRGENTTTAACPPRLLSELYSLSLTLITSWEENVEDDFFSSVLSSLTAPRLTNLALERAYNQEELAQFHTIQSFLTRSSCSLQVLSLNNIAVTDSGLVTILKQCVTLEALHIVDTYPRSSTAEPIITKAFIESLHSSKRSPIQESPPPIVKSLRSLTLTLESSEFDAAVFVDMVSSRWIPDPDMAKTIEISCLRSVELFLPAQMKVDREAYQPLLPFEKAGMMIVVKQETKGYVF
ncbi:hypothetical protein BDP27DRAFT_766739 [Rhodocollybia butyracea]|uniref:Uncharacterized protein n=1 Tax=Rhodocollybia butyracea TaxID=206335 RepID=A0A9P5P4Q2_9AGAR|nr:hypothetical protein BDP27DRAFT_766739 [Rhodocollybia butyracea]